MNTTQPSGYSIPTNIMGIGTPPPVASDERRRPQVTHLPPRPTVAPADTEPDLPRAAAPTSSGRKVPSSTWLPIRLVEQIRAEYTARGIGAGELFKEALEFSQDVLGSLIADGPRAQETEKGGLFGSNQPTRRRAFDEPTQTITYRMAKADQQILDELVARWGATSRGHLIGSALDHYFTHRRNDKE